jgi:MinD-like ATPase involved in chromosome partitioning or flagellar assembly
MLTGDDYLGIDYPVFEPGDEKLAEIIVRILRKRGYDAGYQTSYPQHAVVINVDSKEEADKISKIIKDFMDKFPKRKIGGLITYDYDESIVNLGRLIPETPRRKHERFVQRIMDKIDREEW